MLRTEFSLQFLSGSHKEIVSMGQRCWKSPNLTFWGPKFHISAQIQLNLALCCAIFHLPEILQRSNQNTGIQHCMQACRQVTTYI